MLTRDRVDVETVAHVLHKPHGIGAVVNGIAQDVENVSVGIEFDGLEEGLVLLEVSVKVCDDVGHMWVLSARWGRAGGYYIPLYYTTADRYCQDSFLDV